MTRACCHHSSRSSRGPGGAALLLGIGAFLLLACGLALGLWRHNQQHQEVLATAQQERDFVANVRVQTAQASSGTILVSLPATTSPFTTANIFARASGLYRASRGRHRRPRQAGPVAGADRRTPELDHQSIAQAEATLVQLKASAQQAQANLDLAQVTWNRDKPLVDQGWVTQQQGTVDVQTLKAQQAALAARQRQYRRKTRNFSSSASKSSTSVLLHRLMA